MERLFKYSGISWVGSIPKEWNVLRNKNVFICRKDLVGRKSATVQLLSLTTKGIKAIKQGETSGKVPESYDTYQKVEPNNIVMCLFDLDCSAVFAGISKYTGMISPAYKVLSCKNNVIPQFIDYWFIYVFDGRKFMHYSKNIRYSLTYEEFSSLKIIIPPLEEQIKIADYLDKKCGEIDALIALQEQMISQLADYKQSVITEAVTKGLNPDASYVPSGIDWIENIPKGWKEAPLKTILQRRSEKNKPIKTKERLSLSIDKGVTLYAEKTTNLDRFKEDFDQYQLAYPNDIVLNSMNMIVGAVGLSKYFGCVSPVYYVIYSKSKSINIKYYSYLLNTQRIRDVYHSLGQGIYAIERGEGRVNTCRLKVSYDDFGVIRIPIPPLEEQEEITSYLDKKCSEIDMLIAVKQQKIERLKDYKKSVIYEAVTGKTIIE